MVDMYLIAGLLACTGVVILAATIRSDFTSKLDKRLLAWMHVRLPSGSSRARKKIDAAARDLTALGGDTFSGLVLLFGVLILARGGNGELVTALAAIMIGARIIGLTMKQLLKRERPPAQGQAVETFTSSFPSIHTEMGFVSSFVIASFLTAGDAAYLTSLVIAGSVSAVIGFTRLHFSVHWPSDVLAGWLLGLGICSSCIFFLTV